MNSLRIVVPASSIDAGERLVRLLSSSTTTSFTPSLVAQTRTIARINPSCLIITTLTHPRTTGSSNMSTTFNHDKKLENTSSTA